MGCPMIRQTFLACCAWLCMSAAAVAAAAPEKSAVAARFEALLLAMSAAEDARREFVRSNFTQAAIERRGVDALAQFLTRIRADIGTNPPQSVRLLPDRIEARFLARGETLLLTVALSAAPESKIEGFLLGPGEAAAQAPAAPVAAVELPRAIAAWMDKRAPDFSGAVIVAKDGAPIFARAYGDADRETHRANTLDTPFNLASDNKMFTALVIASLVEQGKLDWNDKVGKFLPDWPQADVRDNVTIEHLLTHTSGLGEYWGAAHDAQLMTLDSVTRYAALIARDAPAAAPGKAFRYSNNGYVLLGLIAEKASGRDYYALVRDIVYRPAGMTHSDHYNPHDPASGVAIGYDREGHGNTEHLAVRGSPAGGGYASANDLLKFANALQAGRIVKRETLARMTARHADMGGANAGYGYGFGVFQDRERHFGHNGGAPGISAAFEVFPDSGYVVIALANVDHAADAAAQQIHKLILARQ